jgi:hypothetical protein
MHLFPLGKVLFHVRDNSIDLSSGYFGLDVGVDGHNRRLTEGYYFLQIVSFHGTLPIALAAFCLFTSSSIFEAT